MPAEIETLVQITFYLAIFIALGFILLNCYFKVKEYLSKRVTKKKLLSYIRIETFLQELPDQIAEKLRNIGKNAIASTEKEFLIPRDSDLADELSKAKQNIEEWFAARKESKIYNIEALKKYRITKKDIEEQIQKGKEQAMEQIRHFKKKRKQN